MENSSCKISAWIYGNFYSVAKVVVMGASRKHLGIVDKSERCCVDASGARDDVIGRCDVITSLSRTAAAHHPDTCLRHTCSTCHTCALGDARQQRATTRRRGLRSDGIWHITHTTVLLETLLNSLCANASIEIQRVTSAECVNAPLEMNHEFSWQIVLKILVDLFNLAWRGETSMTLWAKVVGAT